METNIEAATTATPTQTLELPASLEAALSKEKLSPREVGAMLSEFSVSVSTLDLKKRTRAIIVTDESQTELMKQARDLRVELKNDRVRIEKLRVQIKEPSLRRVQVIDGTSRIIQGLLAEEEAYLYEQENFAKVQREKRENELKSKRQEILRELGHTEAVQNLGTMSDADFELILAGVRATKAEAEKLERERQEQAAENARLKAENERLVLERAESDRKAREAQDDADRKVREAEAEAQRLNDEAERIERERIQKDEAEKQRLAEEAARLAAAPDREKLAAYAETVVRASKDGQPGNFDNSTARILADNFQKAIVAAADEMKMAAQTLRTEITIGDCPF